MWLCIGGLCAAVLSLAGLFLYLDPQVPKAETYRNVQLETPLRIYTADGALLAEFGERRLIPITLEEVPEHFIDALLDTEDKRFYQHSGIDFISLGNDVVGLIGTLITEGELGPGASTITMQLARNVSFSLERRFLRKFKEMLLALKIERELTKDEILELYINIVPFGKRAYGAEAAARTYYAKSLHELNLAQLAMLAGIPQRPSAGNPINGPEWALSRRNLVLSRMLAQGSIDRNAYSDAIAQPITAQVHDRDLDVPSPYAAEWVRQQAVPLFPDLYTGGYEIVTTLDAKLQKSAIRALRKGLEDYDQRHGYRGPEAEMTAEQLGALLENVDPNRVLGTERFAELAEAESEAKDNAGEGEGEGEEIDTNSGNAQPARVTTEEAVPAVLRELAAEALNNTRTVAGHIPALVVAVDDKFANVLTADGVRHTLAFAQASWARPFVDVDYRAPLPERFSELLQPGHIVRIKFGDKGAMLSQLPEIQGALVALDPNNGRVRSLVGGYDFYANQYNHALQAARQPGSGFKPFVYSAAIANGITPADIFMDAPLVFDDANLESQYRPDNDNNAYNGPTRLREALYRSINLVSMRVLLKVGAGNVLDHVANMGFSTTSFPRNTQLAIGGGTMAITPMDMAVAYAVLANGGFAVEPHVLDHVKNSSGRIIYRSSHPVVCDDCQPQTIEAGEEPASLDALLALTDDDVTMAPSDQDVPDTAGEQAVDNEETASTTMSNKELIEADQADTAEPVDVPVPQPVYAQRVLDKRNAFIMGSMLRDVIRRGTGVRARALGRDDIGGKTGTTNDAADTWFNGFHPDLVATVWVGFSNHQPLGAREYGSTTPLPIWVDFMRDALPDLPERIPPQPAGVVSVKIDPQTGKVAAPGQRDALFEYFLAEHAPERSEEEDKVAPGDTEVKPIDLF